MTLSTKQNDILERILHPKKGNVTHEEYHYICQPVFAALGVDISELVPLPTTVNNIQAFGISYLFPAHVSENIFINEDVDTNAESNHIEFNRPIIAVACDMSPVLILTTYAHEVGHIAFEGGFMLGSIAKYLIAEAIAIQTEYRFIHKFNEIYGTEFCKYNTLQLIKMYGINNLETFHIIQLIEESIYALKLSKHIRHPKVLMEYRIDDMSTYDVHMSIYNNKTNNSIVSN